MKNKLSDLNDHLFAQLERLSDPDLAGEKLKEEVLRSNSIVHISDQIIGEGKLRLAAVKLKADYGHEVHDIVAPMIGGKTGWPTLPKN